MNMVVSTVHPQHMWKECKVQKNIHCYKAAYLSCVTRDICDFILIDEHVFMG